MRPSVLNSLFADITVLPGVGPKIAALISRVAGPRVIDMILTPPVSIIDRSLKPKITDAPFGLIATMTVTVDKHDAPPKGKRRPYKIICSDETGYLTLVFFHARGDYLKKQLPEGSTRIISGRVEEFSGARQMTHPDYILDPESSEKFHEIEPVYPLTAGLSTNVMRKAAISALGRLPTLPEWQDPAWLKKNKWPSFNNAVAMVHAPQNAVDLSLQTIPRQRLAYDELIANQLAIRLVRKARVKANGRCIKGNGVLVAKAKKSLSFQLTNDQKTVLREVFLDMHTQERMVRLIQGDVGSGKTIVAFFAALNAIECGFQAALMAPTEILAQQHAQSLTPLCEACGISITILTGRDKSAARNEKNKIITSGKASLIIGTHALFQGDVEFSDLALVIIDEQHRFGVHQRIALTDKGPKPDLMVMTATPIPRTLALTAYGDMDVSLIKEKPPGRKPVETRALPVARLEETVEGLRRAIAKGEQAYWVCPLVSESDVLDLTAAEDRFEFLKKALGDNIGLVHGKMTAAEKDAVMDRFHNNEITVLIATTVIEVGVNAPNATIMIIEHAERFGLAQLHQLRGRVGRGEKTSSCILLYKAPLGETATARLKILRDTEDGFRIAEEDLRLRGAGDLLGAAQSGYPRFRYADLSVHNELLSAAQDDAKMIIDSDGKLQSERGKALRTLLYFFSRDDATKLLSAG